jgi:hypothetical protein
MAATRAEIQEAVEEILSPLASRLLGARLGWRAWLVGLLLCGGAYGLRRWLAPWLQIRQASFDQLTRMVTLGWLLAFVLVIALFAWARAAAPAAARAFRARFPPDGEARRWAFRQLLRRWHEQPAARALGRVAGTAPGRSTRSTEGVPFEENVFATVAPLDRSRRILRGVELACGGLCAAAILYPLGVHRVSVWGSFGCGLLAALVGWLFFFTPAKQTWKSCLDGVRARWQSRFATAEGATPPTLAVLARVSIAVPPAAELIGNPLAGAVAPPPAADAAEPEPADASPSLAARFACLGARLPLRLPRPVLVASRPARRQPPLREPASESEFERRRDLEALVQSLRRVQRPHVLILWCWWLFPLLVWVLAALGRQEMSFWRGFFVWLLMGFALSFPSMGNRNQALDWARRTFTALFPPGSPGRTDALQQIESFQGAIIVRELVVRLRPPMQAADVARPPVEEAVREALSNLGASPQGIPLPSAPSAPAPRPPPSRPPAASGARSSRGLPLVLPGAAPEDPDRKGIP